MERKEKPEVGTEVGKGVKQNRTANMAIFVSDSF
jgi:hypothetical protein